MVHLLLRLILYALALVLSLRHGLASLTLSLASVIVLATPGLSRKSVIRRPAKAVLIVNPIAGAGFALTTAVTLLTVTLLYRWVRRRRYWRLVRKSRSRGGHPLTVLKRLSETGGLGLRPPTVKPVRLALCTVEDIGKEGWVEVKLAGGLRVVVEESEARRFKTS